MAGMGWDARYLLCGLKVLGGRVVLGAWDW